MLTPNYFFIFAVSQPSQILWSFRSQKKDNLSLTSLEDLWPRPRHNCLPASLWQKQGGGKTPIGQPHGLTHSAVHGWANRRDSEISFCKAPLPSCSVNLKAPCRSCESGSWPELQGVGLARRQWATFCREREQEKLLVSQKCGSLMLVPEVTVFVPWLLSTQFCSVVCPVLLLLPSLFLCLWVSSAGTCNHGNECRMCS